MSPANVRSDFQADSQKSDKTDDATKFVLSLATAPFLVAFLAAEKLSELLLVTGQASEEIFRGDRLPVLNFPSDTGERDS